MELYFCDMDKHKIKIFQKELGKRLTKVRIENNLTQAQVAAMGIISQSHLSKIETGEILVNIFVLQELAKIYKIDIKKLLEYEEK